MLFEGLAALFFLLSAVLIGTAVVAWKRVESPAVDLFGVVTGTLGVGCLLNSIGFVAGTPVFVLGTTVSVALILPLPWIMFSFDYIGRQRLVATWPAFLLAIPIILGLSATITIFAGQLLPQITFLTQDDPNSVVVIFITALELSQWVGILYAGGLVLTGTGLVLWSFQRYPHLDSTTGTVLSTFGAVPWISVLLGLQLESGSFLVFSWTVAVGFSIGAVTAVALVGFSSLFERVPSAGNVGPTTVIGEFEDAVVIADGEGQVIEMNPSARQLFERRDRTVGADIPDLFESSIDELRDRTTVEIESESRQSLFDPTVSDLTDQHGQLLGYAIVLRNVTERTIRKQRLSVFNRLLRHNLRNDMSVILGWLEVIRRESEDSFVVDKVDTAAVAGQELMTLSDKIRESRKVLTFDAETSHEIAIESLVEEIYERVESTKTVEFHYQGPEEIRTVANRDELRVSLQHLIDNAVQHSERERVNVWTQVTTRTDENYPVEIAVRDDGPGIPESEKQIITSGRETSLDHSSGVGLWTVRWITRSLGGKIAFQDREPSGTVVKLLFSAGAADEDKERSTSDRIDS